VLGVLGEEPLVHLAPVGQRQVTLALAAGVSFWRKADLERDIGIATLRSFLQLTAIGYVIALIFEADTLWLVLALLVVMVVFGALTARSRAKKVFSVLSRRDMIRFPQKERNQKCRFAVPDRQSLKNIKQ